MKNTSSKGIELALIPDIEYIDIVEKNQIANCIVQHRFY